MERECTFNNSIICETVTKPCVQCGWCTFTEKQRKNAIHDGKLSKNKDGLLRLKLKEGQVV